MSSFPARSTRGNALRWGELSPQVMERSWWPQWSDVLTSTDPARLREVAEEPPMGQADSATAFTLARLLEKHTQAQSLTFLTREGYGDSPSTLNKKPRVTVPPDRVIHLHEDTLNTTVSAKIARLNRVPMYWIPEGHAWFVGADIYARSFLVGGSAVCIEAIMGCSELEAHLIKPHDTVAPED
ncbi:hypothetical protein [Lysinibacter sp. HNR]|uniref:hypothetical protein n=1 Tax=Lysinibacter sp. HNR TaxID=3031408 RepID=UPI002434E4A9|nr:hypothetical protein [Lysinibacter sp. HNR]WGD37444.1 hypothetical protein FrondiHNR_00540 [Lysinibacter sp. HNR]